MWVTRSLKMMISIRLIEITLLLQGNLLKMLIKGKLIQIALLLQEFLLIEKTMKKIVISQQIYLLCMKRSEMHSHVPQQNFLFQDEQKKLIQSKENYSKSLCSTSYASPSIFGHFYLILFFCFIKGLCLYLHPKKMLNLLYFIQFDMHFQYKLLAFLLKHVVLSFLGLPPHLEKCLVQSGNNVHENKGRSSLGINLIIWARIAKSFFFYHYNFVFCNPSQLPECQIEWILPHHVGFQHIISSLYLWCFNAYFMSYCKTIAQTQVIEHSN